MDQHRNPTDLNAQARAREQQDRAAKVEHDAELLDVKWLMSNVQGRRFMWRLLEKTGVYRTSFTGNSHTFFNEGQRNIGLMLLIQINETCPELYLRMQLEAADERKARNAT